MPEAGGDAEARGGCVLQFDSSFVSAPDNTAQPVHGTILAFDFGERRVGVAVGETALALAHPLTTLAVTGKAARFDAIAALIAEWKPAGLVVGLPVHMDDSEHEVTAR
ncbi:MAG: Holliday junction resolvase RuvX, partial [Casimicrobiaceae bacterium]